MRKENLKSIDDYESFLREKVQSWSPIQRVALAAAMAERWLPVYEAFSSSEKWGDPASLHNSLEVVWSCASGHTFAQADLTRHRMLLRDNTPHMDDFDAPEALAACVILDEALECCTVADNLPAAVRAALSGFEAAMPDWIFEPEEQPHLWKQITVRKELRKQLKLVEQIEGMTQFDNGAIDALRKKLVSREFAGEASLPSSVSAGPTALTNQQAFEQYRRMVESDLRRQRPVNLPGAGLALMCVGVWSGRYSRRRQTNDGSYGPLADVVAQKALVTRQRVLDAAEKEDPTWDPIDRRMIELSFSYSINVYDVKSPYEPHGYGPSVRRLWVQAKRTGRTDVEAWESIIDWARHRPAAWDYEDRRRKKGQAYMNLILGEYLVRQLTWAGTDDVEIPWSVEVDGKSWRVRLNDFPDDFMYTLLVDDTDIGSFHDWPENWQR